MSRYDLAVIGGGPAGAACAALCAQAGWRVLVLERAVFPREKVCGDCVNPACWPVLDRLGVGERVLALPHSRLETVKFIGTDRRELKCPLPVGSRGEIAVKRRHFDAVLLERAQELGATIRTGQALTKFEFGWRLWTGDEAFEAEHMVAADGRNSTTARVLGLLPAMQRDRLGLQAHLPCPAEMNRTVAMHFLPEGYAGIADVGGGAANVCLVGAPPQLDALKHWTRERFSPDREPEWHTIAPLSRAPLAPEYQGLLLTGDAARVVEPFTGEGIYYALASGALAADHLTRGNLAGYAAAHRALYRGRLWVNELAKAAVLHPEMTTRLLGIARHVPGVLRYLTRKVVAA